MKKQKIVLAGIIGCILILIVIVLFYPFVPSQPSTSPPSTSSSVGQESQNPIIAQNAACKGQAGCFSGQVTRVIDGDTIVVNDVHVRFALAAAPELSENGGIEAKNFIESLCPVGSNALVDEDDGQTGGSYGRTIAEIYCNNQLVNSALLEKGLGTIDTRFCGVSEFADENWAKKYGC